MSRIHTTCVTSLPLVPTPLLMGLSFRRDSAPHEMFYDNNAVPGNFGSPHKRVIAPPATSVRPSLPCLSHTHEHLHTKLSHHRAKWKHLNDKFVIALGYCGF